MSCINLQLFLSIINLVYFIQYLPRNIITTYTIDWYSPNFALFLHGSNQSIDSFINELPNNEISTARSAFSKLLSGSVGIV